MNAASLGLWLLSLLSLPVAVTLHSRVGTTTAWRVFGLVVAAVMGGVFVPFAFTDFLRWGPVPLLAFSGGLAMMAGGNLVRQIGLRYVGRILRERPAMEEYFRRNPVLRRVVKPPE